MKEVVRQEKHIGYVYIPIDGGNIEDCSRAIDTFPHCFMIYEQYVTAYKKLQSIKANPSGQIFTFVTSHISLPCICNKYKLMSTTY